MSRSETVALYEEVDRSDSNGLDADLIGHGTNTSSGNVVIYIDCVG
jgi:hypothetical protein